MNVQHEPPCLPTKNGLASSRGEPIPIFSMRRVDEKATVYNIQVGSLGSYIAYGVIVHNKEFMEIYPCEDC